MCKIERWKFNSARDSYIHVYNHHPTQGNGQTRFLFTNSSINYRAYLCIKGLKHLSFGDKLIYWLRSYMYLLSAGALYYGHGICRSRIDLDFVWYTRRN